MTTQILWRPASAIAPHVEAELRIVWRSYADRWPETLTESDYITTIPDEAIPVAVAWAVVKPNAHGLYRRRCWYLPGEVRGLRVQTSSVAAGKVSEPSGKRRGGGAA